MWQIAEDDIVDANVAPGPGFVVDNLDYRTLAEPRPDIPARWSHPIVIFACRSCHNMALDQQVQARLLFVRAASNQKIDVLPLDRKWPAGQVTDCRVPLFDR